MARAYASIVLKAPVETVWSLIRDFNGLPRWAPAVASCEIEGGGDSDVVGCMRSLRTKDGIEVRERPLTLDDANHSFTYNFEKPAYPVRNYIATTRLYPVTHTDETFAEWEATFDEASGNEGKHERIIAREVFSANWANLAKIIAAKKPRKPEGAARWKGFQPSKVWTSRVIRAPVDKVWGVMRDFAGMGAWHEDITGMRMLGGVRPDKVSGIRDFRFGEGLVRVGDRIKPQVCDVVPHRVGRLLETIGEGVVGIVERQQPLADMGAVFCPEGAHATHHVGILSPLDLGACDRGCPAGQAVEIADQAPHGLHRRLQDDRGVGAGHAAPSLSQAGAASPWP